MQQKALKLTKLALEALRDTGRARKTTGACVGAVKSVTWTWHPPAPEAIEEDDKPPTVRRSTRTRKRVLLPVGPAPVGLGTTNNKVKEGTASETKTTEEWSREIERSLKAGGFAGGIRSIAEETAHGFTEVLLEGPDSGGVTIRQCLGCQALLITGVPSGNEGPGVLANALFDAAAPAQGRPGFDPLGVSWLMPPPRQGFARIADPDALNKAAVAGARRSRSGSGSGSGSMAEGEGEGEGADEVVWVYPDGFKGLPINDRPAKGAAVAKAVAAAGEEEEEADSEGEDEDEAARRAEAKKTKCPYYTGGFDRRKRQRHRRTQAQSKSEPVRTECTPQEHALAHFILQFPMPALLVGGFLDSANFHFTPGAGRAQETKGKDNYRKYFYGPQSVPQFLDVWWANLWKTPDSFPHVDTWGRDPEWDKSFDSWGGGWYVKATGITLDGHKLFMFIPRKNFGTHTHTHTHPRTRAHRYDAQGILQVYRAPPIGAGSQLGSSAGYLQR